MSIARSPYKDELLRIGSALPLMLLAAAEDDMVLFTFVKFLLNHSYHAAPEEDIKKRLLDGQIEI
jgi:hypothetical protein